MNLKNAGVFQYVRPFSGHQTLKSQLFSVTIQLAAEFGKALTHLFPMHLFSTP